ncbi:MAG: L,D-transpeptidase family protein [Pseudomonadota bacterium]|nr:L,D-transpeptidase family protein [Sphingomonas sp.]MDQ3478039.1 L,D-transpeptidase family protein [Pseudomonadota bacterium]
MTRSSQKGHLFLEGPTTVTLRHHLKFAALACAVATLPFIAEAQQTAPAAVPAQQPVLAAPEPAPLPPPPWDPRDAQELLAFIEGVGREGLDPGDYDPAGLSAALRSGNTALLNNAASDRFTKLASDLALGHVRGKDRVDWHIKDPDLGAGRLDQLLRFAVGQHQVARALQNLLPVHPQYTMLKKALEVTPPSEVSKLNRIRLNLDRWRWLPRDLGDRYIIVNVPAYTAALVENGNTLSRHYAVAGAIKTPTPQLSVTATGVILNPWWEIPKSIEPEVRGKRGYVALKGKDGRVQRWRQPPGPSNALGQVKFVMPNPKAIFLHDTNARSKFNSRVRAFSHGCIRTKDIMELSTILLTQGDTEWTREKIQAAVASGKSVQANFAKPLPVYIIYMSSAATVDGRIVDYADVYRRDGKAVAALLDTTATATKTASR